MKPLAEAQAEVLRAVPELPVLPVPLGEALGLVLAEDVSAPHDVPSFANSAMDGYALRAVDVVSVPVELTVLEDVAAGHVGTLPVTAGTAVQIMTGAPIPEGADTVVKVEDTEPGEGTVRILAPASAGTAVRPAGGDLRAGEPVFGAGTRLGAVHLGVLATIGVAFPPVTRRPRVAILSTGDELRPVETSVLQAGQIRDSNRPLLAGLLAEARADVVDLGTVPDDADSLRSALRRGTAEADAIVTSGGVSMGEYDLVKQVLTEMGDIGLWRVAMQPAKPFAFGLLGGTPLFGLPGNPVSALVAFEQFVRPALLHMMGAHRVFRPRVPGRAGEELATDPAKVVFVRVQTELEGEVRVARSAGGQSSNVLSAAAAADAFAVVPVGTGIVAAGESVVLEMFRWPETRSAEEVLGG